MRFSGELHDFIASEFVRQRHTGWLRPASADVPEAILLWGTLGYAAYLSQDGRVWLERDFLADQGVRPATAQEAVGAFVKASERHGLFQQLVPERPATAHSCAACGSSGRVVFKDIRGADTPIWCGKCEGVGWFLREAGYLSNMGRRGMAVA